MQCSLKHMCQEVMVHYIFICPGVGNDSSNYLMKIGCALYLVMEVQTERPLVSGLARIHLYWSFIVHQRLFLICWPNGLC